MMAYLLDANIFIQAKNLHYGMDFCPAFWEWLIANNAAGTVFSIEKVGDEIEAGGDELSDWAAQRGSEFFLKPDPAMLPALATVSTWANGQRYEPGRRKHVPASGRLLFGSTCTRPRARHRDARKGGWGN